MWGAGRRAMWAGRLKQGGWQASLLLSCHRIVVAAAVVSNCARIGHQAAMPDGQAGMWGAGRWARWAETGRRVGIHARQACGERMIV
jgi:hypothetical protein